jgi:D-alanyl-lipoteichoic acid acyltransferase DltB (MBOAT superfamily)
MLFNSLHFAVFFVLALSLYWAMPGTWRKPFLTIASYYFYGAWDFRFVALLICTTGVDFVCGRLIFNSEKQSRKKLFLTLSLTANLAVLGFFKYFNFFTESFCRLLGIGDSLGLSIILPVGVSFYTFQSMSYTIDIFRGKLRPASFIDYFLFVSFFPQLIAGPIVRAGQFLPQENNEKRFSVSDLTQGLSLFLRGFVKKVLFADLLARAVDPVFADPGSFSAGACLLAVYGFAFQIYWDFSGYTDMARGAAKTLGYDLPINFNLPYISKSFGEFWQRWHISLSSWLRDYLYISLGGNRHGTLKTLRNLFITMALGGLWHGAHWHFVLWGIFHGTLLACERVIAMIASKSMLAKSRIVSVIQRIVVFHFVCAGWVLFRCPDLTKAKNLFETVLTGSWGAAGSRIILIVAVASFMVWEILSALAEHGRISNFAMVRLRSVLAGAAVALAFLYSTTSAPFLYFQF